jgi:hypothetical protein
MTRKARSVASRITHNASVKMILREMTVGNSVQEIRRSFFLSVVPWKVRSQIERDMFRMDMFDIHMLDAAIAGAVAADGIWKESP